MYKGRSCLIRKTKQNSAWTRDELILECQRLNISYTSRMTKLELCQLLIEKTSPAPALTNQIKVSPTKGIPAKVLPTKVFPTKALPNKVLPNKAPPNNVPPPRVQPPRVQPVKVRPTKILSTKVTRTEGVSRPTKIMSAEVSDTKAMPRPTKILFPEIEQKPLSLAAPLLTSLPRDIRYKIMLDLPTYDLANMCLTNKTWYDICNQDEFWRRRVLHQFGNLLKPEHLTYKDYYQNLISSGNLFVVDDEGKHNFIDSDVIKAEAGEDHIFYINIKGELRLHGEIHWSQLYFGELNNNIRRAKTGTSIELMSGINDFFFSHNYSVFLTTDSKLMAMSQDSDGKLVEIMTGVKKLCAHISMRFAYGVIKDNNDLYWSPSFRRPTLEKIAADVTFVTFGLVGDTPAIYYVKNNSLWVYYPTKNHAVGSISRPGVSPDNITGSYELSYKHILLIEQDVKSISTSTNYLLVVDVRDELWIYGKNKFYSDYKYNDNYVDEDDEPAIPKQCQGEGYKDLAGFDQDCYHRIVVRQISTGYQYVDIGIVDQLGHCYKMRDYELRNNDLPLVSENVISCFVGSNLCYIKDRFST